MDAILNALGGLLLKALPTFLLLLLLHLYLKRVFYRPLEKVLQARFQSTEGARKLAAESMQRASKKAAEYEAAIREARAGIYQEQEEARRQWRNMQAESLAEARRAADSRIKEAKAQIASEAVGVRRTLEAQTETLAARIVESLLEGKAN